MVRLTLTFRENVAMLRTSRDEALTDALTALGNRRALTRDLDELLPEDDEAETAEPLVLALFDLDGFKHYNDTFGHPAGDALLVRLGGNLAACLEGRGRAFRMGGDEFCVLFEPGADHPAALVESAAAALSESGEGFTIGCSYGSIRLPDEAADPAEALRIADQRMYASEARRPHVGRAPEQGRAAARAGRAQPRAGRPPQRRRRPRRAHRPPPRAPAGRGRAHPPRGRAARRRQGRDPRRDPQQAGSAHRGGMGVRAPPHADRRAHRRLGPVAAAMSPGSCARRHERWDGSGYPDRLAGDAIPLGSRIVAVADAYDAMISSRPHAAPRTPQEAIEELRRCSGTQFDPAVVETFRAVLAEGALRAAA